MMTPRLEHMEPRLGRMDDAKARRMVDAKGRMDGRSHGLDGWKTPWLGRMDDDATDG